MYDEKGKQQQVSHLKRRFQEEALRQQLEEALKQDGNEVGDATELVLDRWMEDESSNLDSDSIELVLDTLLTQ